MRRRSVPVLMALGAVLCAATSLPAQSNDVTAIMAGTLIEGTGGPPVRNAVILVKGERITAVANGMDAMDAIVAGTRGAADLLGVSNDVGTIETYKIADLVAVDGDPLTDINVLTRPVFIMHAGRIVVGD